MEFTVEYLHGVVPGFLLHNVTVCIEEGGYGTGSVNNEEACFLLGGVVGLWTSVKTLN